MALAGTDLFRASWSSGVEQELLRTIPRERPDIKIEQVQRILELMRGHLPGALVMGYEGLINGIELPDLDDRHIVAAAIRAQAQVIVTANLRDFPAQALCQYDIEAIHPDEFILDLLDLSPAIVVTMLKRVRRRWQNPPHDPDEFIEALRACGLPMTATALAEYRELL